MNLVQTCGTIRRSGNKDDRLNMNKPDSWKREEIAARLEHRILQGRVDWESLRIVQEGLSPLPVEDTISLLVNFLAHSKWRSRRAAAESLVELGDVAAESAGQVLHDKNPDKRYWASWILSRLGEAGLPALLKAVRSKDPDVRERVVNALGFVGVDDAIQSLIEALGDPVWRIRSLASTSLVRYGDSAFEPLLEALNSDNSDVCFWAARTLGGLMEKGKVEDIGPLVELLAGATGMSSRLLVYTLGMSHNPEAIKEVASYMGHPDREVRIAASRSLERAGLLAVEPLFDVLRTATPEARYWAATALGRVLAAAEQDVQTELIESLNQGDMQTRMVAARALGAVRTDEGIAALIGALSDPVPAVRRQVADCLYFTGQRALPALLEAARSDNSEVVHLASVTLGKLILYLDENPDDVLGSLMKNEDTIEAALTALGTVGTRQAAEQIQRYLTHSRWVIRERAAVSLVRIGAPSLPVLASILDSSEGDERFWAARAICWLLVRVGEPVLDLVLAVLRSGVKELAIEAIRTLGGFRHPKSIEALIEAFGNKTWVIRSEASDALCRFGPEALDALSRTMKTTENRDIHYWSLKTRRKIKEAIASDDNW